MRRGRHHLWLSCTLACSTLALSSGAKAQTWLSDRTRAEGIGIRVGDLELHPGIGAEVGYISNVYNAEAGELASAAFRISPHLFLSTLSGERAEEGDGIERTPGWVKFRGGISASLFHYFADETPDTDFGTDIDLQLTLAPERPVSFMISEVFRRAFRPFADPVIDPALTPGDESVSVAPDVDFVRYHESIGARLMGRSRGGLLQGSLGYRLSYDWYEEAAYSRNDALAHTVDMGGGWEFLPKSALFYDLAFAHQNYTKNEEGDGPVDQQLHDNEQVTVRLGFNGAITSRISATLAGGYAAGFFSDRSDYEGLILNAEGRWQPSAVSIWALGFTRSFSSAYQGDFVKKHQIYTHLRMFFAGVFVLAPRLSVEFLDFGPTSATATQGPRGDIRYSGELSGEYRVVDWLAITAQLSAVRDDSDYIAESVVEVNGDEIVLEDPVEYTSFEGWLGLRVFY